MSEDPKYLITPGKGISRINPNGSLTPLPESEIWTPTLELRWRESVYRGQIEAREYTLQQFWTRSTDGAGEWRDVPTVRA